MPTYTYKCEAGHYFEEQQPMSAAPLEECELLACAMPVQRVVVAARMAQAMPRTGRVVHAAQGPWDRDDGYQAHLAAFPGDPAAFTSGKLSKQRLIDQRHREGWVRSRALPSDVTRQRNPQAETAVSLGDRVKHEVLRAKQEGRLLEEEPLSPDAPPQRAEGEGPDEKALREELGGEPGQAA